VPVFNATEGPKKIYSEFVLPQLQKVNAALSSSLPLPQAPRPLNSAVLPSLIL